MQPKASHTPRRIIIAIDASYDQTPHILEWTRENILKPTDKIDLVTCWSFDSASSAAEMGVDYIYVGEMLAEKEKLEEVRMGEDLERLSEPLQKAGHTVERHLLKGPDNPADLLVTYSNDASASILVIGSRGLSALKRFLVGSFSDYCVHSVKCPVMVVKGTEEHEWIVSFSCLNAVHSALA